LKRVRTFLCRPHDTKAWASRHARGRTKRRPKKTRRRKTRKRGRNPVASTAARAGRTARWVADPCPSQTRKTCGASPSWSGRTVSGSANPATAPGKRRTSRKTTTEFIHFQFHTHSLGNVGQPPAFSSKVCAAKPSSVHSSVDTPPSSLTTTAQSTSASQATVNVA